MDAKPMEIPEGFTPGPWRVEGPDTNRYEPCWRFISSPKGNWYHFANVAVAKLIDGRAVDNPEGVANAALIAMAPDMAAEILALRAERDALAARLAVPGEEELDRLVAEFTEGWESDEDREAIPHALPDVSFAAICREYGAHIDAQVAEITALRARVEGLEGALQIAKGLVDTPIGRRRLNLSPDDERLTEIRAALSKSAQEARDAE